MRLSMNASERLMENLCDQLGGSTPELRKGIEVHFVGNDETGSGDGHRRELFRLASEEMIDLKVGLFVSYDGNRTFHVSTTSGEAQPDHLAQFELCGKVIGLALLHGETLPTIQLPDVIQAASGDLRCTSDAPWRSSRSTPSPEQKPSFSGLKNAI